MTTTTTLSPETIYEEAVQRYQSAGLLDNYNIICRSLAEVVAQQGVLPLKQLYGTVIDLALEIGGFLHDPLVSMPINFYFAQIKSTIELKILTYRFDSPIDDVTRTTHNVPTLYGTPENKLRQITDAFHAKSDFTRNCQRCLDLAVWCDRLIVFVKALELYEDCVTKLQELANKLRSVVENQTRRLQNEQTRLEEVIAQRPKELAMLLQNPKTFKVTLSKQFYEGNQCVTDDCELATPVFSDKFVGTERYVFDTSAMSAANRKRLLAKHATLPCTLLRDRHVEQVIFRYAEERGFDIEVLGIYADSHVLVYCPALDKVWPFPARRYVYFHKIIQPDKVMLSEGQMPKALKFSKDGNLVGLMVTDADDDYTCPVDVEAARRRAESGWPS